MAVFSPITSNKLYVQIYNQIYEAITSGIYKIGDKLPSEKELSQMFNVSRVPVREALCALELNGIIDSIQGVGMYVKNNHAINDAWLNGAEPREIIEARIAIEPEIARAAAQNITEEGKENLRQIVNQFKIETDAEKDFYETDKRFHQCITCGCGNSLFSAMMDIVFQAMEHQMWELILERTIKTEKYSKQNFIEHKEIAEAIIEGDADLAYERMKQHMNYFRERYWE